MRVNFAALSISLRRAMLGIVACSAGCAGDVFVHDHPPAAVQATDPAFIDAQARFVRVMMAPGFPDDDSAPPPDVARLLLKTARGPADKLPDSIVVAGYADGFVIIHVAGQGICLVTTDGLVIRLKTQEQVDLCQRKIDGWIDVAMAADPRFHASIPALSRTLDRPMIISDALGAMAGKVALRLRQPATDSDRHVLLHLAQTLLDTHEMRIREKYSDGTSSGTSFTLSTREEAELKQALADFTAH